MDISFLEQLNFLFRSSVFELLFFQYHGVGAFFYQSLISWAQIDLSTYTLKELHEMYWYLVIPVTVFTHFLIFWGGKLWANYKKSTKIYPNAFLLFTLNIPVVSPFWYGYNQKKFGISQFCTIFFWSLLPLAFFQFLPFPDWECDKAVAIYYMSVGVFLLGKHWGEKLFMK